MEKTNLQEKSINVIKRKLKQRQQRAKNNFWRTLKNVIEPDVSELEYAYFL